MAQWTRWILNQTTDVKENLWDGDNKTKEEGGKLHLRWYIIKCHELETERLLNM